ncbi:TPA: NAD-dependent epimerase/dehydratase family protein [Escherichia coli]
MSQVLITGATGLVGGHLLRMLINEPKVNAIAAPTRRPLGDMPGVFNPHDPQLTDALAQVTDPIDIVFCCLGTTRREAGSKECNQVNHLIPTRVLVKGGEITCKILK